jgi:hypothetical protein
LSGFASASSEKLPAPDLIAPGGLKKGEGEMWKEFITKRDDLLIRRLVLEPGEAMPWRGQLPSLFRSRSGEELSIEFRDTGEHMTVNVHPGMVGWDQPDARVHHGVNTGATPYEEVVTFFLDSPNRDPQPEHS